MFSWLSGFLFNPTLAVGTLAVASPILIHILSRRRFRKVPWAAMEFLLVAQKRNRRRVRLEQLILLALRCLAVFLIAMMIARPFVRPNTAMALLGSSARTERLVILDDSFSMLYRSPGSAGMGQTVFDQATAAVERLAKWIAGEAEADSLTLMLTSRPEAVSLALPSLSEQNLLRLHDHLAGLSASHRPAEMSNAIASAANLLRSRPMQANTHVYVVSDFQRRDWIVPARPGESNPRSPLAALAELPAEKRTLRVGLIDVGAETPVNAAITALTPAQPQTAAGVPAKFNVSVANYTASPMTDVEIANAMAAQTLPPILIPRIDSDRIVRDAVEVTYPNDGSEFLRVSLASAGMDGLPLDNTRATAVSVAAAVRVLIVDGEPNADPYLDEVYLLRTALRPQGRAASGNDITVIDDDQLDQADLSGYHVVILANALRISETAKRSLETYVRGGGGLAIFVGDQVDADLYNQRLFDEGRGVMPVAIGRPVAAPQGQSGVTFEEWDVTRPMLRAFTDNLASILKQVRVTTFVAVDESTLTTSAPARDRTGRQAASSTPSAMSTPSARGSASSAPAESEGSPTVGATVIARFGDPQRSAALIERPFGRGHVLLVTTSVDQEWNDWASSFSFVPMMLEMVQHLARQPDETGQVVVGTPLEFFVEEGRFARIARLRTPDYPNDPEIALEPVAKPDGRKSYVYDATDRAGIYRFELTNLTGDPVSQYVAVNLDEGESNLARAARADLDSALTEMKFDYLRDLSVLSGENAGARRELWWPLLLAAAVVLMTEHGLAWWFGARN